LTAIGCCSATLIALAGRLQPIDRGDDVPQGDGLAGRVPAGMRFTHGTWPGMVVYVAFVFDLFAAQGG
jgi:hypothetical protein